MSTQAIFHRARNTARADAFFQLGIPTRGSGLTAKELARVVTSIRMEEDIKVKFGTVSLMGLVS